MMDGAGGLFKGLADSVGLIFFAFFGGIIRTIYRPRSRSLKSYMVSIMVSVPLGVLAGMIGEDYGLTASVDMGLAVLVGIISHDIIEAVFWTVDKVKSNRESLWSIFFKRLTGKVEDDGKV